MRAVVGVIGIILMAAATGAQAQSEPPQSATAPQPAQDVSPKQAAPAKTSPASTAAADKKPTKLFTPGEKYLLRQGYKLEVRDGTKYFCRNQDTLGTRLREHKVCGTEQTLASREEANNDNVRENLRRQATHYDGK
jgi:pyruvate/2-oxoglutarate dehydrogenase complex dihydrolipoamide acyltransferase (E2) component